MGPGRTHRAAASLQYEGIAAPAHIHRGQRRYTSAAQRECRFGGDGRGLGAGRHLSGAGLSAFGGFGLVGLPVGFLGDAIGERATLAGMAVVVCGVVLWQRIALARTD